MNIRIKKTARMTAPGKRFHIKWLGLQSRIRTQKAMMTDGIRRNPDKTLTGN